MAMARLALTDHRSFQNVQGSKQCRCAVALVVMGLPLRQTRPQGQNRLRAVQRLNLTLLVYAQHNRFIRGIHVKPHDVPYLRRKIGVVAELERFDPMRLQFVFLPDPQHGRRTHLLA